MEQSQGGQAVSLEMTVKIQWQKEQISLLKQRIKRLEEALAWYESTVSDCNRHGPKGDVARDALARDQGRKAKEAKP
jgi:hypothetical protein